MGHEEVADVATENSSKAIAVAWNPARIRPQYLLGLDFIRSSETLVVVRQKVMQESRGPQTLIQ